MSSLRSILFSFLVGVAITSVAFIFLRPATTKIQQLKPTASPTPTGGEISPAERERCKEALGLFLVPLLEAPAFEGKISPVITSMYEGDTYLRWSKVPNAKDYLVLVTDLDGKEVKTYRTSKHGTNLKDLPRPKKKDSERYQVKIATVNANDLIGEFSPPHELVVKKLMNLTAPKIKEIRIED